MILFFDIDGTLIGGGSQLMSESTKRAICRARENGHLCFINTGRTRKLVGPEITEQVEFDGFLLGCGTMVVYHDEVLIHQRIPMELSVRILEGLKRYRIDAIMEGAEDNYCEEPEDMYTDTFRGYISLYKAAFKWKFYSEMKYAPGNFDKFFAYADDKSKMDAFRAEFEEELDFIDRENGYYEVVPKGCSKASAMEFLAERMQVSMEDTVALGDSNNDLPMLECAGISIAMRNSSEAVLAMADYVTTDVGEDGIWNALKWLGVLN